MPSEQPDIGTQRRRGRRDVSETLLRLLLLDPTFLMEPMSERAVCETLRDQHVLLGIDRASVSLSALREAVIGFLRDGWLQRTPNGVMRDLLDSRRLINLFGLRVAIEHKVMHLVLCSKERGFLATELSPIVKEQSKLTTDANNNEAVEWLRLSVQFHVTIAQGAGQEDLARILENLLWHIKIGLAAPLDGPEERAAITEKHQEIVSMIRNPGEIDDGKWNEDYYVFDHFREPFAKALSRLDEDVPGLQSTRLLRDTTASSIPTTFDDYSYQVFNFFSPPNLSNVLQDAI